MQRAGCFIIAVDKRQADKIESERLLVINEQQVQQFGE